MPSWTCRGSNKGFPLSGRARYVHPCLRKTPLHESLRHVARWVCWGGLGTLRRCLLGVAESLDVSWQSVWGYWATSQIKARAPLGEQNEASSPFGAKGELASICKVREVRMISYTASVNFNITSGESQVHGLDERQYNFRELTMLFRATRQVGNLGAFLFHRARIHDS